VIHFSVKSYGKAGKPLVMTTSLAIEPNETTAAAECQSRRRGKLPPAARI